MHVACPITFASELYTQAYSVSSGDGPAGDRTREEAIGWYATLETSPYELVFRAPSHLHRAEIYEEAGDREQAIEHYRVREAVE